VGATHCGRGRSEPRPWSALSRQSAHSQLMKIMARIVADSWRSADAIVSALRAKGYATHISEDEILDDRDCVGNDVFLEATIDGAAVTDVCREVDAIAETHGGICVDAGDAEGYLADPWAE
jgi:hypothetical protein